MEAALQDVRNGGSKEVFAWSALHGLSEWAQKGSDGINNGVAVETILASVGDSDVPAAGELTKSGNLNNDMLATVW